MKSFLIAILVASAAPASAQTATARPEVTDAEWILLGRRITEWFFTGQTDSLLVHMSPDLIARVGGTAGLLQKRENVLARLGGETAVIVDTVSKSSGRIQYWRESRFELGPPEPEVMRMVFNAEGLVIETALSPLSQTPPSDQP